VGSHGCGAGQHGARHCWCLTPQLSHPILSPTPHPCHVHTPLHSCTHTHPHARLHTHKRTHAHTRTRAHNRSHTHTRTHTRTRTPHLILVDDATHGRGAWGGGVRREVRPKATQLPAGCILQLLQVHLASACVYVHVCVCVRVCVRVWVGGCVHTPIFIYPLPATGLARVACPIPPPSIPIPSSPHTRSSTPAGAPALCHGAHPNLHLPPTSYWFGPRSLRIATVHTPGSPRALSSRAEPGGSPSVQAVLQGIGWGPPRAPPLLLAPPAAGAHPSRACPRLVRFGFGWRERV